ncbi:ABC transporter permease [Clostridium ganghwense]|uniref:ABC transporter permease n=1 Tax=Clostridium ganghwense TaxID=312089 RepID=A0ABT4CUB7_9CLOT|nr:ABC transporter permease [Clostridium ganghwense]MCY6372670.1 ABC transporter permease [Clostridium ganghwense]
MRLDEYKKINFLYAILLILILWQSLAFIINKPIFPTPFNIMKYTVKNFSAEMVLHLLYSLKRVVLGILFTLILGVPLAIIMAVYERADSILSPILYFNYPVPKIALLPIVMLIFGLGEFTKIIMIFLITFFPMVVNVRDAVKNIPEEIYYPMYSLGATKFQIILEIIFPGIYSTILTSIRISIGTAISILFFTENFGTKYGMGYFIMDSWMRVNYVQMYSGIVILSIIGLVMFIIIDILETIICPWQNKAS